MLEDSFLRKKVLEKSIISACSEWFDRILTINGALVLIYYDFATA